MNQSKYRKAAISRKLLGFEAVEQRRLLAGIEISESIERTIVNDNSRGFDSYLVSLDTQPTSDVTVAISSTNPLVKFGFDFGSPGAVFTPEDWSPKRVIVWSEGDQVATGNLIVTLNHSVVTTDPLYQAATIRDVAVTVIDTDSQIWLPVYDYELMEGQSQIIFPNAEYPSSYNGPSIDFAYDTNQVFIADIGGSTATITAINDGIEEGIHDVPIIYSASGQLPPGYSMPPNTIVRISDPITPQYTGFQINSGQQQRSMVDQIRLNFSDYIFVSPGAMTLTNTTTGAVVPVFGIVGDDSKSLNVFPGQNFSRDRTLADGMYELFVPGWSITHAQSGIPIQQDIRLTFADGLFRLFGDLNGNGSIDKTEVDSFNTAYQSSFGESKYIRELDELGDAFIGTDDQASFRKIKIDNDFVSEDASSGAVVGNLTGYSLFGSVVGFELVSVDGQTSNLPFTVSNGQLVVNSGVDFESNRLHRVEIRGLTQNGSPTVGQLDIRVTNVNENANASIRLTNENVLENVNGLVGNLYVYDSAEAWQFSLASGPGDYDNGLFEIEGDQLVILDLPDYESRDDYSVHIVAQSSAGQLAASLTINITPVDEFAPERLIFWTEEFGEWDTIPYLVEKSPVGQPATRIRVVDGDRGEVYTLSGFFADLAIVQGDAFVPIREINYEDYVWPHGFLNSVTAVSANGVTYSNGGDTASIIDVNDAPILAETPLNQTVNAGETAVFTLPPTTFFDEDSWDFLTLTASISNGPLPDWLSFEPTSGTFIATPSAFEDGDFEITVQATDSTGVSVTASFQLDVVALPRLNFLGTAGNDRFQIDHLNGSADSWRVVRNGQVLFSGNLNNSIVSIDGLAGNDRVTFGGSNIENRFELFDAYSKFDEAIVVINNIEQLDIEGGQGNDQLTLYTATSVGTASVAFNGNGGTDFLQTVLDGSAGPTQWNIAGRNRGNIGGWLDFQRVEQLLGSYNDDEFNLLSNGSVVDVIDGVAGLDVLRTLQNRGGAELTVNSLGPFVGNLDGMALLNLSRIDLGNSNATAIGPEASSEPQVSWSAGSEPRYVQLAGSQAIDLYGFTNLVGRSSDDQFVVWDQSTDRTIDGGSGFDALILAQTNTTQVNLQSMSASGVDSFSRLESIQGTGADSTIFGPNRDVQWTYDNYVTTAAWRGTPGIQFINFGSILAGDKQDNFSLSTFVIPDYYRYPSIHGGGGSDTIETFHNPNSIFAAAGFELLGPASGYVMMLPFDSIENLVGGAISDLFTFYDLSPNDQWFQSIRVTETDTYSFIRFLGQQGVTVNFRNSSATGVGFFDGVDYLWGTDAYDTVIGSNQDSDWYIQPDTGTIGNGLADSVIGFEGFQAGSGNDYMHIMGTASPSSTLKTLNGGGGSDTLSFAWFEAGISVSLAVGFASIFANGIGQFENVYGSPFDDLIEGDNSDNILVGLAGNDQIVGLNGNDMLVGSAGNDFLFGGAGRDLLIGGTGSDWLYGGSGDDLIISGTSNQYALEAYDEYSIDFIALNAIMAEWSSNRSYSQRINRLRSGVGSSNSIVLSSTSIQSDDEVDQVFGEGGSDWFWLGIEDLAPDRLNGERLN